MHFECASIRQNTYWNISVYRNTLSEIGEKEALIYVDQTLANGIVESIRRHEGLVRYFLQYFSMFY